MLKKQVKYEKHYFYLYGSLLFHYFFLLLAAMMNYYLILFMK